MFYEEMGVSKIGLFEQISGNPSIRFKRASILLLVEKAGSSN
jgi:hypothetical protein